MEDIECSLYTLAPTVRILQTITCFLSPVPPLYLKFKSNTSKLLKFLKYITRICNNMYLATIVDT